MKALIFLLLGVALSAASVEKSSSQAAIKSAVEVAVQSHVSKYKIGGRVVGSTAAVEEIRPMSGWNNKYNVTGTVTISISTPQGQDKQKRSFSAVADTGGGKVSVSDISI